MRNYIIAAILIVAVASSCHKKAAPVKTNDTVALFGENCAKCHGANGTEGKAPHLTGSLSKNEIVSYVTNGHGKMPAFKDKLTSAQIDAIAGLVLAFQKKAGH